MTYRIDQLASERFLSFFLVSVIRINVAREIEKRDTSRDLSTPRQFHPSPSSWIRI